MLPLMGVFVATAFRGRFSRSFATPPTTFSYSFETKQKRKLFEHSLRAESMRKTNKEKIGEMLSVVFGVTSSSLFEFFARSWREQRRKFRRQCIEDLFDLA